MGEAKNNTSILFNLLPRITEALNYLAWVRYVLIPTLLEEFPKVRERLDEKANLAMKAEEERRKTENLPANLKEFMEKEKQDDNKESN